MWKTLGKWLAKVIGDAAIQAILAKIQPKQASQEKN